ncbi:MAG: orotidine 5'-phosphate decarboxylase [Candidatus Odinarchaeum yellowstonii]|uniref:Orotidine 5'-phosphate decarboxylase n=1 Tax=Odinarchaeota yellowstonii (strain LCB_4) TaxID=1841599 RepID=A0AAF0D1R9_ODILC|nr:MAG: orotidine 5'-phosphate decarboxylase [Candidatus Odinarchaeum yellowstonii]
MGSKFITKLEKSSKANGSKLIIALDISSELQKYNRSEWVNIKKQLFTRAESILDKLGDKIAGVKINNQLLLPLGLYEYVPDLISLIDSWNLPVIADIKINDVGHTNEWIAKHFFNAGFDALIANPFVGWDGGLDKVFETARRYNGGVILLVYMSHPGALEGFNQTVIDHQTGLQKPQFMLFAEKANNWGADGVIVGATSPQIIKAVRSVLNKNILILSPGVGVQGGEGGEAIRAGASYIIVGRSVFESSNPSLTVTQINEILKKAL